MQSVHLCKLCTHNVQYIDKMSILFSLSPPLIPPATTISLSVIIAHVQVYILVLASPQPSPTPQCQVGRGELQSQLRDSYPPHQLQARIH